MRRKAPSKYASGGAASPSGTDLRRLIEFGGEAGRRPLDPLLASGSRRDAAAPQCA